MASGSGGRGRGRGRGSGGRGRGAQQSDLGVAGVCGGGIVPRECESCRSAPGIPFCRVEWSFLCTGCAAVVHGHNWIVAVPPNPNPNLSSDPLSAAFSYPTFLPFPCPNPAPNPNPNSGVVVPGPNHVVQLSSDEDDEAPSSGEPSEEDKDGGGQKRRRRYAAEDAPVDRAASVMRYKEKRNSRNFDKTVRYEKRKEYANSRPRVDGKFARAANAPAREREVDLPDTASGGWSKPDAGTAKTDALLPIEQFCQRAGTEAVYEANVPVEQLSIDAGEVNAPVAEANAAEEQLSLDAGEDVNAADANEVVRQLLDGGLDLVGHLAEADEEDRGFIESDDNH